MNLDPPITGKELLEKATNLPEHTAIIDGLLYEHDTLMISADSGKGKSLISIQIAMHLTVGSPVFGSLRIPTPKRIWYIQMERHQNESLERLNKLMQSMEWNPDNFFLDTEPQILSFIHPEHYKLLEKRALDIKPDVIFIDPLYGVAQGLSQDVVASEVSKCFTMLKKKVGCALYLNHHVVKDQYFQGQKVEKDDPFYGATWIKAHVTGSYFAKQNETGMEFIKKKDSHDVLLDSIHTVFDQETYMSTVDPQRFDFPDRLRMYLHIRWNNNNKKFLFKDACTYVGCAVRTMRNLLNAHPFKKCLERHKSNGSSTLYEIISLP